MTQSEHYHNLYKRLDEAERLFQAQFFMLRDEVFEERPGPDRWSVGECLRHLIIANEHYLAQIEKKLPKAKEAADAPSRFYKGGYWGQKLPELLAPDDSREIGLRMKTFRAFVPKTENLPEKKPLGPEATKKAFERQLARMKQLLQRADRVPHRKVRISSPVVPVLRFYLGDAFAFVLAHTERHLAQAEAVVWEMKERELR